MDTKAKPIILIVTACIPLASLIVIELYVSGFEGWGAWAAAPLLLIPAVLSMVIVIIFIFDLIRSYRSGETIQRQFILFSLALTPAIWLFARRFFR